MAGLKYFYDLMSQPCRAVYLFLKMNNIPYKACPVALRSGEHLKQEFTKITPFQLVPVIDDNGFKLTESVAILRYLSDKYQVPDHWYPKDLQHRAMVDVYMEWQHLNMRINGAMVFRIQVIEPLMTQKPVNVEQLETFKKRLDKTLNDVEKIFLAQQPYLCGSEISIGDLLGICELMQPAAVGFDVYANRPKLKEWAGRVQSQLAPHFDESHQYIFKLRDRFKSSL